MNDTLLGLLETRVHEGAESSVTFVEEERTLRLSELLDESRATARGLISRGVAPGDRVAYIMQNGSGFLKALFGAQYAHAVPVPLALPFGQAGSDAYARHVSAILKDGGITVLVVDSAMERVRQAMEQALPGICVVSLGDLVPPVGGAALPAGPVPADALAYIQYTSGSTSAPKGVALTHGNVIAGLNAIAEPSAVTSEDRWGMWAPLFHDMGIFSVLTALSVGADVILWHPRAAIRNPLEWLRRFVEEGCTLNSAPNFFLDALVTAVRSQDDPPAPLDLSKWRLLYNGAEPVNVNSIEEFQKTFGPWGFRPQTMYPVYGMAEATLAVTFPVLGREPVVRWVDRESLLDGRFVPADEGAIGARPLVSLGQAVPGVHVRISVDGRPAAERQAGEIEISGPAVTPGYFGRPPGDEHTADGWIRTGDMGVMDGGHLFIFGRLKDMVIVRGVNYYAEDVEAVVRDLPGVYRKRCATLLESEHMALVVETDLGDIAERAALVAACRREIKLQIGIGDVVVYLAPPRFLPQTSSGKVQRNKLRRSLDELTAIYP
ncbi:AMP-binding protein [Streptomyces sp. cmx-4-9]|uniref:AMP-binding protein n=1 Tax=Streptomyces sp. cmx-4-9 TaxID=2790941 RepID=UPI00397EDB52